jgi:hypothetical protein
VFGNESGWLRFTQREPTQIGWIRRFNTLRRASNIPRGGHRSVFLIAADSALLRHGAKVASERARSTSTQSGE